MKSLLVKITCFVLAMFLVSCAANNPAVSKSQDAQGRLQASVQQSTYGVVTNAISRGDWDALRKLAKPGMTANEHIKMWENYERASHPMRVGKLRSVEKHSNYYLDGKPCTTYSFALENKDGSFNPHWLQILVREESGRSEILDFMEFGW